MRINPSASIPDRMSSRLHHGVLAREQGGEPQDQGSEPASRTALVPVPQQE